MADNFIEIGQTGLKRSGGMIREEFLPELAGDRWQRKIKEMSEQDPVITAELLAIEMLLRQVDYDVEPAEGDTGQAEFVESCFEDMSSAWPETLSEILTMLPYGWAYLEVTYKRRRGESNDPKRNSRYTDNKIGWRKWSLRAQDSLWQWKFDDSGGVQGMWQSVDGRAPVLIPIEKSLLFRTTTRRGNPEGKALALDTPVPTPDGWTTMGDIAVGDKVFDETGKIRYVTAKSDVWRNRDVYRVTFSSGNSIVADESHEWSILTANDRTSGKPPRILTTKEIFDWKNRDVKDPILCAGVAPVLDTQNMLLPIDPYILGYWLGDGSHDDGSITVHVDDFDSLRSNAEKAGYTISFDGDRSTYVTGIKSTLRDIGLLKNKHIPQAYLRMGFEQRLALLQGLMDSDGTSGKGKDRACKFYNSNEALVKQFCELLRTLGCRPHIRIHSAPGKECGTINGNTIIQKKNLFEISFYSPWVVHRLERKASIQTVKDNSRVRGHYVRTVEYIGKLDTVCIEVDSPSHLFLAGEGMTPTHNSVLRGAYRPYHFKKNLENIEGIGVERDLAGLPVAYMPTNFLRPNATASEQALYNQVKEIVTSIRRDEQEGIVWPMEYDEKGNELFKLELMSAPGSRQFDIGSIIQRYNTQIAMTTLADFITLGHENVGSYSLSATKDSLFKTALEAWLDSIAGIINTHAIPRLLKLNGMDTKAPPKMKFGGVGKVTLDEIAVFLDAATSAGMRLFPSVEVENELRSQVRLPLLSEDEAAERAQPRPAQSPSTNDGQADGQSPTDEQMAALLAQIRMAKRVTNGI